MGLLRVSGTRFDSEVVGAIRGGAGDGGVRHGRALLAFADAAMQRDPGLTGSARALLTEAIGEAGVVDAAAVTAMFQLNTRAADAAGGVCAGACDVPGTAEPDGLAGAVSGAG